MHGDVLDVLEHASADAKGTGSVTVSATEAATINADIASLAATVAIGAIAVAASGAGVAIENQVNNSVLAHVDSARGIGIRAGDSVNITASDTSTINATASAVSFAAALGLGGAGAISISKADNTVSNDVQAYATLSKITTTTGGLTIKATENASVITSSTAASLAVGVTLAVASSGASATGTVTTTTRAYADPVELDINDDVAIDAISTGKATVTATGNASAVGFISIAAAVTKATTSVKPTVESRLGGYADARKVMAGGDISVASTAAGSATSLASGGSFAVGFSVSVGETTATATIAPATAGAPAVRSSISGGNIISKNKGISLSAVYNADSSRQIRQFHCCLY